MGIIYSILRLCKFNDQLLDDRTNYLPRVHDLSLFFVCFPRIHAVFKERSRDRKHVLTLERFLFVSDRWIRKGGMLILPHFLRKL